MLRLEGPSLATLRDLCLLTGDGNGICVTNCDQQGGLVHADQLVVAGRRLDSHPMGVLVNGLEHTAVQFRCLGGGYGCSPWVRVVGDADRANRDGMARPITVLCGGASTPDLAYDVAQGGAMVVRSIYHEICGDKPDAQAMLLTDLGAISVDATNFSYRTSADLPLIETRDLRGSLAVLTSKLLPADSTSPCQVLLSGDGQGTRALIMANMFWQYAKEMDADSVWSNRAVPPATAGFLHCIANSNVEGAPPRGHLEERGEVSDTFILEMLEPLREVHPWLPQATPAAATNLRLYRANCGSNGPGAQFELRAAAD